MCNSQCAFAVIIITLLILSKQYKLIIIITYELLLWRHLLSGSFLNLKHHLLSLLTPLKKRTIHCWCMCVYVAVELISRTVTYSYELPLFSLSIFPLSSPLLFFLQIMSLHLIPLVRLVLVNHYLNK